MQDHYNILDSRETIQTSLLPQFAFLNFLLQTLYIWVRLWTSETILRQSWRPLPAVTSIHISVVHSLCCDKLGEDVEWCRTATLSATVGIHICPANRANRHGKRNELCIWFIWGFQTIDNGRLSMYKSSMHESMPWWRKCEYSNQKFNVVIAFRGPSGTPVYGHEGHAIIYCQRMHARNASYSSNQRNKLLGLVKLEV